VSIRDRVRENAGFMSRLRRYPSRGWVAGVCAGLAEYFDWNVRLLRVICIIGLVCSGFFPIGLIYIGLWYLMEDGDKQPVDRGPRDDHDPYEWSSRWSYRREQRYQRYSSPSANSTDVKSRFSTLEQRLRSMEECVASKDFELRRELKKLEG
jgi:phage shock protein C